jgi:hypothetical protein
MFRLTRVLILLSFAVPTVAAATGPKHVRREQRELKDDLRDARLAEKLLQEFRSARRAGSRKRLQVVEARVAAAVEAELRESRQEVREQAVEVARSREEVREDKRAGMNTWDHKDPQGTSADRRALADDRRDLMREAEYRDRVRIIQSEWKALRGDRHTRAMNRKVDLLKELVRLAHYEIRATADEVREGQHELREGQ